MQRRGNKTKRTAAMYGAGFLALIGVVSVGTAGAWTAYRVKGMQNALASGILRITPDTPLNRRLVEAVQREDIDGVRTLCAQGASADTRVFYKDSEKGSPIPILAWQYLDKDRLHFLPVFQSLIARASDPGADDDRGNTLLTAAIDMDDLVSVQNLVSRGANVNARMKQFFVGANSLYMAVMQGGTQGKDPSPIVLFLLEHGADVNAQDAEGTTPLILAAEFGKTETVKTLLAHGADPTCRGLGGLTALRMASRRGHDAIVALLSEKTPLSLMDAAQFGKVEQVRAALKAGAKPNEMDASGRLPLIEAMKSGSVEVAKLLLDQGASAGTKNKQNKTALNYAAMYGDVGLANLLLDSGADVNAVSVSPSQPALTSTPLIDAIGQAQAPMVDFLLKRGADLKRNGQGAAALELAVRTAGQTPRRMRDLPAKPTRGDAFLDDQSDIVEHLLAAGADARANNSRALYLAVDGGQMALASLLLDKGADVNGHEPAGAAGRRDDGRTALMAAVQTWDMAHTGAVGGGLPPVGGGLPPVGGGLPPVGGGLPPVGGGLPPVGDRNDKEQAENDKNARSMVEMLLSRGANVNIADGRGRTALMECSGSSPSDLPKLLLAKGANVNAADDEGRTALMQAACQNDLPFATFLLTHKADIGLRDKMGLTALMLAIDDGENAFYLTQREESDDHLRNAHGENPPPVTRKDLPNPTGHPDMVRLLLKNGADPNAAAKDGITPLKLAQKNGFDAVVTLLKQAGAK